MYLVEFIWLAGGLLEKRYSLFALLLKFCYYISILNYNMIPDISIRINALIAYLFLGPIILLAKSGTPLSHPFVQWHAKRASIYILLGIVAFILYRSIHTIINVAFFGINIATVILGIIISIMLLVLIKWAYDAFQWIQANESNWKSFVVPENTSIVWSYTDEDKVRIIASFFPFIWSFIAKKYPKNETKIGSKISNFSIFLILLSMVFFSWGTATIVLILTLIYIAILVITAVQLFVTSQFLQFGFYKYIPTYQEFDAHIKTTLLQGLNFIKIAFWSQSTVSYAERYNQILSKNLKTTPINERYFAPNWIIALPIINLICIPSLWQKKYNDYIPMILQWLLISIFTIFIIFWYWINSQIGLFIIFPIIAIITEWADNLQLRAPFTSIMVDIYSLFNSSKNTLKEIEKNGAEKVTYTYNTEEN